MARNADAAVVVTGFGPFGDVRENPSWLAVRALAREDFQLNVGGRSFILRVPGNPLDVSYRAIDDAAAAGKSYCIDPAPDSLPTRLVVHVGVGLPGSLRLESVAWNAGYRQPDCDGERKEGGVCVPGAPQCLRTTLNLEGISESVSELLQERGNNLGVEVSKNAGRYLCEYIYFKSLHTAEEHRLARPGAPAVVFVHVPPVGQSADLESIKQALGVVIEACLDDVICCESTKAPSEDSDGSHPLVEEQRSYIPLRGAADPGGSGGPASTSPEPKPRQQTAEAASEAASSRRSSTPCCPM